MAPRKKKLEGVKILRYPDSAMQAAITAVREGRFKIREAARHFSVPHSTLINKVKGRVPGVRKMGRDTYFTENEENLLVKYIIASAKKGIPIKRNTLIETVKKILDDDERVTPFKNNRPGKKWVTLFCNRHSEITEKQAEGISTARANVSENDIKSWHQSLKEYLVEENAVDILKEPKRIFNADESGFQTCPESGKVLGPVGMKNFYQIKAGKEKEQLTVMVTINAAGQIVTPMIVYPLVRISKEIATNVPENWGIGKSPKGWMTGPLYFEYIANILDPWVKANNIKKPILLLIDGHRSHLTLQVSQYCAENKIIAYALFPNSTHISQPADVSVFKCLKSGWKNTVCEFKERTANRQITRAGFAPLLAKVFKDKVTPDVIINGFKRCGIYPFDVTAVDLTRCMDNETRKIAPVSTPPREIGVETLLLFESFMRRGRVEQFRRSNEQWEGEETAKELFYVWKKFRHHCLSEAFLSSAEGIRSPSPPPQNQITLPVETKIPTPCSTPVSKTSFLPEEFKTSTRYSSPVSGAPDLQEESEASTRCSTPISTAQFFSEPAETPTRNCTTVSNAHLPEESETTTQSSTLVSNAQNLPEEPETFTRSCTPVSMTRRISEKSGTPTQILKSITSNHFECHTAPPAAENKLFTSSSNLILLAEKQKQISPAFGNHLIWPSDSPIKKPKKERLPFATTSKKWQDYWLTKENEKDKQNRKTEIRKRVREEKQIKKSKQIPKKTTKKEIKGDLTSKIINKKTKRVRIITSDTSDTSEAISDEEASNKTESEKENEEEASCTRTSVDLKSLEVGHFVIFVYEGAYFVGKIDSIFEEGALINSMHQSLKSWKWPEREDLILYQLNDIKEKIQPPQLIHQKRGLYHVPEFKKYREYI